MSGAGGVGHFVSWDGGCLLIGRATGVIPVHAHYAIQIAFGSERGIRFRPSDADEWTEYGGAIIASRQPHSMDASVVPSNVVMFIEPETREGRALTELYLRDGIAALPDEVLADVAPPLFDVWREQRSVRAIVDAARRLVQACTRGAEPAVVSDERILRAVSYIKAHLDAPLTLEDVAAQAFLSPSRFRHLFVEQTGMALRPYILWRRFVHVWELLTAGESLSTAAHRAGFADAAHLTRTSRRMFGFPPSALQMAAPLPSDSNAANAAAPTQPLRSRT
ncbi:MAG TPA: AraC family transcriptional regulator [Gemmatimonadaceae bacterium]|nr:AraC family transcriptional regulator [Gemmatimonadaceae bacterium]